jgi:hypothetical protein
MQVNPSASTPFTNVIALFPEPGETIGSKKKSRHEAGSGAEENRTPDLFNAIEALYQLSYSPGTMRLCGVELRRIELLTSSMPLKRSTN